ncbi:MAG: hypothetical protein ACK45R_04330, partial [Candidatus Kapaibacterium sp.]
DVAAVRTGTFSAGSTPVNPTESHTAAVAPATLNPSTSTPTNNTTPSTTDCFYDAVAVYGQAYIYSIN